MKISSPWLVAASLGAGLAAFTLLDGRPAQALVCGPTLCYTFNNAVANDVINQNTGSLNLTGSFNVGTGTSIATATEANVTTTFNTPPGTVGGNSAYFFNRVYFGNIGGNNALVFFCVTPGSGTCTTPPDGYNSGSASDTTYQMILGFGTTNFATGPFPSTISLVGLNNGNINQICSSLDSGNVGTNTCDNGENNRFELSTFDAGSTLEIPTPLSALALTPLAALIAKGRKRYQFVNPSEKYS